MDLLTILPNLSIGVVAVLALAWYAKKSMETQNDMHKQHMKELKEREVAMREVEKEVRTSITTQLNENTKIMHKVAIFLESKSK